MATIVARGMLKQNNATFRQAVRLPSKNTINRPSVAAMPESAIKTPLIDGSLNETQKNT